MNPIRETEEAAFPQVSLSLVACQHGSVPLGPKLRGISHYFSVQQDSVGVMKVSKS